MLLQFTPGQLVPSLTSRLWRERFAICHLTYPISSIQQCLRQRILGITPGIGFLGNRSVAYIGWHLLTVSTFSPVRVAPRLSRSNPLFCVTYSACYPPDTSWMGMRSEMISSPSLPYEDRQPMCRYHFGQAYSCVGLFGVIVSMVHLHVQSTSLIRFALRPGDQLTAFTQSGSALLASCPALQIEDQSLL